ncbi:16S rRNA (guanine(527)-N(7))-methyltransferase RsmG [Maritimibacter sp. HL-12]|uniref:16S rRNA (guanine(527)-N(7))-methyltransferase RsmG n=1 Tax=Maritimibacter sp. HL-12 TaxID=1162418 RepID=UPI000A0EF148|nr:16S rRNA (guanine(527)-N(7))-methyltransferase RsmG [Maritimibacter sp. HL-12]SMH44964.1 16S rRNA m(7)G-527 methyltransferase [Maritimibacter sp. HL-12]
MTEAGGPELFADVSRETRERLHVYAALLERWNPRINLVSASTIPMLWTRHFLDSAQILDLTEDNVKLWADLGTGGGFPGLIVAILARETRPDMQVVCVESDQRKAAFLRTVTRETGISAQIVAQRIEDLDPLGADILSARALAPLPALLGHASRHLVSGGHAVFLKGAGYRKEVNDALESWSFELDTYPSQTDPDAVILKIGDIRRV